MTNREHLDALAELCRDRGIAFEENASLSARCSFKIGGTAALLAEPGEEEDIRELATRARGLNIPLLVLGKGSNILFSDQGFDGLALVLGPAFSHISLGEDGAVFCESGASLVQLCKFALDNALTGLEFAYGIPGTVGGAVYMNAGAYGGEMKDVLTAARHLEPDGSLRELSARDLDLGYRHSVYTDSQRIITGASFRLDPGDPGEIRMRMEDVMERRRAKQPLEYPSAGSTFKRPSRGYASALIDECGLKGCRVGGAVVSEKHAGFVINDGGATAADVLALIEKVRHEVRRRTGVELEPEVKIMKTIL